MAFFDDLSRKVSRGTKDLADSTRLNALIADSKKQIEGLYRSLGSAYYEAHRDDPAAEQPELIAALNRQFESMAQAQDALLQLRGMSKCPNCGAELPQNAQFCSACGARQPLPEQPAAPAASGVCPSCGAPNQPGQHFCAVCGTALSDAPSGSEGA